MDLIEWLTKRGGIAHRADAAAKHFSANDVRRAIREGAVNRVRGKWIALDSAPADLSAAAAASARLTCVSLARQRDWWIPESAPPGIHLHVGTNSNTPDGVSVRHWSTPLVARGPRELTASLEDALAHIASCCTGEDARILWESAVRMEGIDIASLRSVRWRDTRSRELADSVEGLSDSGIETIFIVRLSGWGVPLRQQVLLGGHRVDVVIGSHLVVQIDGFEHHSSSAQRGQDVAHDAELRMRGYTVLRFTYAQIVHGWEEVERIVGSAIARGLHLAPAEVKRLREPALLRP